MERAGGHFTHELLATTKSTIVAIVVANKIHKQPTEWSVVATTVKIASTWCWHQNFVAHSVALLLHKKKAVRSIKMQSAASLATYLEILYSKDPILIKQKPMIYLI